MILNRLIGFNLATDGIQSNILQIKKAKYYSNFKLREQIYGNLII